MMLRGTARLTNPADGAETEPPRKLSPPFQRPVRRIVEQLDALSGAESVTVGQIIANFGRSSFLAMLMLPGLLLVSPLSGIPFFSSVCGLCISLIAAQMVAHRSALWLPGPLMRSKISGPLLHRSARVLRGVADWLDRHSRERLSVLVMPPFSTGALVLCTLAGMIVPFLELVPFASSLIGAMVVLVAVALLVHDGLYTILATLFGGAAVAIPTFVVAQVVT